MKKRSPHLVLVIIIVTLYSCSTTAKIKDGNTAFKYKHYKKALELLPQEYLKTKDDNKKIEIVQNIIKSATFTQEKQQQLEWSKILYNHNEEQHIEQYLQALKANEKYEDALTLIQEHTKKYKSAHSQFAKEIDMLQKIITENKQPSFKVINLNTINTNTSDYGAFLLDNELYYTSHNQTLKDNFTGNGFAQTYVATKINDSTFGTPQAFTIQNFPYHFAQIVFNNDKSEAFFTQCGSDSKNANDYCKIYTSRIFNASWTKPEKLNFFNDSTDEAQPFLSSDNNELYFTSNAKDGYGGSDIYVARKDKNGRFTQAYNLGSKINTDANECFPTIINDTTLYFSSNKKNGIGNLDIYQSTRNGNLFSAPILLEYPINTGADDFYLLPNNEYSFYVSSNRNSSVGKDDIFYLEKIKMPEPEKRIPPVYVLKIKIIENEFEKPNNPNSKIVGTKDVDSASLFLPVPIGNGYELTNEMGELEKTIYYATKFKYKISKPNYLSTESTVNLEDINAKDGDTIVIKQIINLQKIYKDVEITLENIYYDYNKADIRADAKPNLDTLVYILTENPNIKIQLSSHTDCRGTVTYNEQLSQKRAESVVNYLIENGVSKDRLVAKGYGENALLEKCECTKCTEEQHQKNRRTTFKIIE